MSSEQDAGDKRVIGLLGEMNIAMVLHEQGWNVFRPVIDSQIDFVLTRYYCKKCEKYSELFERKTRYGRTTRKTLTNLCKYCEQDKLINIVRFIQVKTSDGKWNNAGEEDAVGDFSFHAKLRHHVDPRTFYVWIAVHPGERIDKRVLCYYVFHHSDVSKFDNIGLPSYQITDNQKTTLRIGSDCLVRNKGKIHSYDAFADFFENFDVLREVLPADGI